MEDETHVAAFADSNVPFQCQVTHMHINIVTYVWQLPGRPSLRH